MNGSIVIYRSKRKSAYIIAGGVILLAASYMSFTAAGDEVSGWIFLVAATLVLILGVANLRDRMPRLILTERGITEPFTIGEEIEWNAILGVHDFFCGGQDIVRILVPRNYKPQLAHPTWFRRFDRIYHRQGVKGMYIRVRGLGISSKQLSTIIKTMAKADPADRGCYLRSFDGRF